ncbi:YabP/YqfC family sporulation protein [Ventrimonas sp. CLA-AP-H27]|uniref:YabP/YqfC family sporulation protein n=2 Tax=Ventrimonas faecis TaxID=3133170 RepID=A0ABV1HIW1_9FIRM
MTRDFFVYFYVKEYSGSGGMLEHAKQSVAEQLKLPGDVMLGEILLSFSGRYSVTVENYRGILLFEENCIRLQGKNCRLQICGKRLNIVYYDRDSMKICGQIQSMEFCD